MSPSANPTLHGLVHSLAIREAEVTTDAAERDRLQRMARTAAIRAGDDGLTDAVIYLAGWSDDIGDDAMDRFAEAPRG